MKKYLFILISISCFGQFNPAQWYLMGAPNDTINTRIGSVSATINTRELLATYLGVNVGRIQKFEIVGSDIKCSVIGSQKYSLAGVAGSSVTYFRDNSSRVSNIGNQFFRAHTNHVSEAYFPGVVSQSNSSLFQDSNFPALLDMPNCTGIPTSFLGFCSISVASVLNIPKCTSIGGTQGYDGGLRLSSGSSMFTIYANSSLQTSNSGGIEGDLADAISRGVTVIWVTP